MVNMRNKLLEIQTRTFRARFLIRSSNWLICKWIYLKIEWMALISPVVSLMFSDSRQAETTL